MQASTVRAIAVALVLAGCGTSYMTQEGWVAAMRSTYPPGTPAADVEASVTVAGMRWEEAPEAFRTLPRSVTGDGSGYWRRAVKLESGPGCDIRRTAYFRFDEQDRLLTVYPGDGYCV